MHKHSHMGTARMKKDIETDKVGMNRGVTMERNKAITKKISPYGLSLLNQNIMIINTIW